jgi:O-antigen/teichoic acid export membrane protein
MGIVFRQSIKSAIAVAGGAALGILINLSAPYLIPRAQLGFSRNIINQAAVLQFVVLLGANNTMVAYLQRFDLTDIRRRALLTASFLFPLIILLVFTVPYIFLKKSVVHLYQVHDQPLINQFFWILPLLVGIFFLHSLFDAFLITEHKTALMLFNREVVLRIATLVLLLLYGCSVVNFSMFMTGHLLAYGLPVIFLWWISKRTGRFKIGFYFVGISKKTWKEWATFSWYHMLTGLALNLIGFLDALLLPALNPAGFDSLALYTTALFVAAILLIPFKAMSSATFPVLNEAYIAGDTPKVRNLFNRSAINILLATLPLLLLLLANLSFLQWLLPPQYASVGMLTAILLIGRFVEISTGLNTEMLSISSEYKFMFRLSVALVVVLLLLNLYLIPRFGAAGAAWSASAAFVIYNIAKVTRLYKRLHLFPYNRATLKVLLAGLFTLPLFLIPQMGHPLLDLSLRSGFIIAVYGIAIYKLRPSEDVQTYIAETLKKGRLF